MNRFALLFVLLACGVVAGEAQVTFQGKTVTMIIGYAAGGGTDTVGRIIAGSIGKYLPGDPKIVVSDMPGAEGTTAANYLAQQAPADGTTMMMGAATQADPLYYRRPQAHFDPTTFKVVGGVNRGGAALIINKEAEKRLHDKTAAPVVMGSLGGVPRAGMQAAAWGIQFLGWNVKWVVGYPGTSELFEALERGEVDMTATAIPSEITRLVNSGKFMLLSQSGTLRNGHFVPQPSFGDVAMLPDLVQGKLSDPLVAKSFAYWTAINSTDEWLSLPPKTPEAVVKAYRTAYADTTKDPEFLALAQKVGSLNFRPNTDVEYLLNTLADTPPEAIAYISDMLRSQGLQVR